VVEFGLCDGNANELCERLNHKRVPFVLHSGYIAPASPARPTL